MTLKPRPHSWSSSPPRLREARDRLDALCVLFRNSPTVLLPWEGTKRPFDPSMRPGVARVSTDWVKFYEEVKPGHQGERAE